MADAETRPTLRRLLIIVPALAGAFALLAALAIQLWWPGYRLVDAPLHSSLEAVGGVTAVAMAVFLLARRWDEDSDSYFVLALGFLGMGLLDLFHSITTPGHGFVLLHSAASLVGGAWFAATWLPRRAARAVARARRWAPVAVLVGSVVFAVWTLLARWTIPTMVSQGRFTATAVVVNLLAGVLFMAAGARLLVASRKSGAWETYLFASVSVLLGFAGLLFPYSPVWGGGWWLWHFVRLIAFLIVMGFLLLGYGRSVSDLRAQIAERRQAEEALRETTDYLEKLLDYANAPIIVWDTAFRITRFNNAFQELTGYSADEVLGKELAMLFPEHSRAESLAKIKATLAGEFWESVEIPILRKEGRVRIALWNSANVLAEDGRLIATIAQGADITERRQAEEELLQMNRTMLALYTIQAAVTQSLDLRKRLHAAIGAVCEGLGLEAAGIYLLEPDGQTLVMRAHKGLSRAFANSTRRIRRGEGVSGKALQLGRPVVVQLDEYPSERLAPVVANEGLRTFASTPLISAGETLGALTLGTQRARVFSAEDLELLATIGKQLGIAVHNALLHEAVRQELVERRQAEEALRETTDYLEKLLDHANAPIIVWDTAFRITRFNNAFQELTGYSADEVVGRELAMLFPEDGRAESLEKIKATLAGEFWESVEIPILKKNGRVRIALWNSANVHGEDGRLMATIAQGVDITERTLAEEALQRSEERYRTMIEHSNDLVWTLDREGGFTYINRVAEQVSGYRAKDWLGKSFAPIVAEADLPEVAEVFEKTLAGEPQHYEAGVLREDGSTFVLSVNTAPVFESGEVVGTVSFGRDITERRRAEKEMREIMDALEKSNAELERFAYVASHDLQEPLRTVASYLQLLEKRHGDRLDGDAKDFIGYAVDGAKRMQTLINDLLAYSRVATRGEPLEPVDLEQVLGHVLRSLAAATQESGAVVTHDRLPWVMGDESQLAQVLQNLIENAIKFRADRPPKVHVAAGSEDGKVVVSVSDNGIGIDPEYFDRVFIIFQRLHSRGDYPGTGIGLAVAKRIVERHGGRMWVRSQKRNGAVFFFTLMPASVSKEGIALEQA